MNELLKNKQVMHIIGEVAVLVGVVTYINSKHNSQANRINELENQLVIYEARLTNMQNTLVQFMNESRRRDETNRVRFEEPLPPRREVPARVIEEPLPPRREVPARVIEEPLPPRREVPQRVVEISPQTTARVAEVSQVVQTQAINLIPNFVLQAIPQEDINDTLKDELRELESTSSDDEDEAGEIKKET